MIELAIAVSFGLLEMLLLAAVGVFVAVMLLREYGHPAFDDFRSRCPQCTRNGLVRIDGEYRDHRLRLFRCQHCGAAFQEQLDGTLLRQP